MYTTTNYKTKKQFKEAFAAGKIIDVFQPNDMRGDGSVRDGRGCIEAPHYPAPHSWYCSVEIRDGRVVKILK